MPPADAVLPIGAELYFEAFWALINDRPQTGFGVSAIPFTAIDAYARRIGVGDEDFPIFANAVRACDEEFVKVMGEKLKTKERKL